MTSVSELIMFILGIVLGAFLQLKLNIIKKTRDAIKKHQENEKQRRLALKTKVNQQYGLRAKEAMIDFNKKSKE